VSRRCHAFYLPGPYGVFDLLFLLCAFLQADSTSNAIRLLTFSSASASAQRLVVSVDDALVHVITNAFQDTVALVWGLSVADANPGCDINAVHVSVAFVISDINRNIECDRITIDQPVDVVVFFVYGISKHQLRHQV